MHAAWPEWKERPDRHTVSRFTTGILDRLRIWREVGRLPHRLLHITGDIHFAAMPGAVGRAHHPRPRSARRGQRLKRRLGVVLADLAPEVLRPHRGRERTTKADIFGAPHFPPTASTSFPASFLPPINPARPPRSTTSRASCTSASPTTRTSPDTPMRSKGSAFTSASSANLPPTNKPCCEAAPWISAGPPASAKPSCKPNTPTPTCSCSARPSRAMACPSSRRRPSAYRW